MEFRVQQGGGMINEELTEGHTLRCKGSWGCILRARLRQNSGGLKLFT